MLTQLEIDNQNKVHGWNIRKNKGGYAVISCHYSVDPAKDEAWVERTKPGYFGTSWDREFEMSRASMAGKRVFQNFKEEVHCVKTTYYPKQIIFRGRDFGYHFPAIVWFQVNEKSQVQAIGELMGDQLDILEFETRVRQYEAKHFCYEGVIHKYFEDWGDPSGHQKSDKALIKDERTTIDILRNRCKVRVNTKRYLVNTMVDHVRHGINIRLDGLPGIIFDKNRTVILRQAMMGGYVYEVDEKSGIAKENPYKDGYWDHLMDALQFGYCGIVDVKTNRIKSGYTSGYNPRDKRTNEDKAWAFNRERKIEKAKAKRFTIRRRPTGY